MLAGYVLIIAMVMCVVAIVTSWDGGESEVNRVAKEEWRAERKRTASQRYNDDIDAGKVCMFLFYIILNC